MTVLFPHGRPLGEPIEATREERGIGGGVSHVNMCDQFLDYTPCFDAKGFYVSIVSDLKGKGY